MGAPCAGAQRGGGRRQRLHPDEIDALQIAAVVACRLEPIELELRGDVVRRDVAAARTRAAALEQIVGEKFYVRANALRIDSAHGRLHVGRKSKPRGGIARVRRGGKSRQTEDRA